MSSPRILITLITLSLLSAVIFIPDWFEDPRKLAPGEWAEGSNRGKVEVTDTELHLLGFGPEESIRYEWLQTENEPYTMRAVYGSHSVVAAITFNGKDEVFADLDIMNKLPGEMADILRKKNRSAGRPENEFRLIFRRVHPKK